MMMITVENTERGFGRGNFKDRNGKRCSIQKSSVATENCIWLGCDELLVVDNEVRNLRMHLNQKLAADLIPLLQHFVDTGELPKIP